MLQLYVFNPTDDYDDNTPPPSALRPGEYLRRSPPWIPDIAETLLLLDPAAGVSLLPLNTFGWLNDLAAQLAEAADRLAVHKRALIRSSIESVATYLALEPGDDATYLSVLAPLPGEIEYSPLPPGPYTGSVDHRAELHAFVEAHRDELRPGGALAGSISRDAQRLQNIRLSDPSFVMALRAESADGLCLYKTLRPNAQLP
jgi:hypothetical protein